MIGFKRVLISAWERADKRRQESGQGLAIPGTPESNLEP